VPAALQIWSATFSKAFDSLPPSVRETVLGKVEEMGTRLESFSGIVWASSAGLARFIRFPILSGKSRG
jgi:hypothetical protein